MAERCLPRQASVFPGVCLPIKRTEAEESLNSKWYTTSGWRSACPTDATMRRHRDQRKCDGDDGRVGAKRRSREISCTQTSRTKFYMDAGFSSSAVFKFGSHGFDSARGRSARSVIQSLSSEFGHRSPTNPKPIVPVDNRAQRGKKFLERGQGQA